ncbi:NADPH2:quinone reductase [Haloactinopolyspora alba]|uniref:NADPH2:quinone reductase n=1 Tax=Haloactinopolyspora alba TaxID=648780 RepID=A0A2P8E6T7_9ACTN|nr:zinc-binding dehydrogenase [Haloactinopolyspora alba]PSL05176.1 NADPH2:quinone reductase [Haloactinopolyspora alba]
MEAIRLHEFGPAENLLREQVPDPEPAEGQVRIAVEASGVHFIDTALRAGTMKGPLLPDALPAIPGREVAGTVDAVADGVDPSWLGARVVAHLGPAAGGYARLAVVAASSLHVVPDAAGFDAAVAMIGTGRTAVAVLDAAVPTADDVVLVTAAAGGLGTLFVQAARRIGAEVVGVAGGPEKVDHVLKEGATHAVDYTESDWPRRVADALGGRTVSLVLDGVGGEQGRAAFDLLGAGGRMVMFGWSSGAFASFTSADLVDRGLTAMWALSARTIGQPGVLRSLEERSLAELASGRMRPQVQRFPLERAAEAHAALENRATTGKVVLV